MQERIEDTGARCWKMHFLDGFAPNVIWCAEPPMRRIHL